MDYDLHYDRNYSRDPRVRARDERWYLSFDASRMQAVREVVGEDAEGNDFTELLVHPVVYAVCPTCRGRGTHVNPSIDCNGLTAEDFLDRDFEDAYHAGAFDVQCYECDGLRVVPQPVNENCEPTWDFDTARVVTTLADLDAWDAYRA